MINESARKRLHLAGQAAAELQAAHPGAEVWLVGALACGYAHAASDIDLWLVSTDQGEDLARSWISDGVRIDFQTHATQEINDLRRMLGRFEIRRDDLDLFRGVRRDLGRLTSLRTARRYERGQWIPVISPQESTIYRDWAVADRAEAVASLTEDLIGLTQDRLHASAALVLDRMHAALASAQRAAAGDPLLGEKWLPLMTGPAWSTYPVDPDWNDPNWTWFRPVQDTLLAALAACHPVDSAQLPPSTPVERLNWLPQYYCDGWFLRRGDERLTVSGPDVLAWAQQSTPPTPAGRQA